MAGWVIPLFSDVAVIGYINTRWFIVAIVVDIVVVSTTFFINHSYGDDV